jgi:hypothetical protein
MALVLPDGGAPRGGSAESLEQTCRGAPAPAPHGCRLGPRPYAGGDAAGVRRAVSARVAKMSSMSCLPWEVMPIVC